MEKEVTAAPTLEFSDSYFQKTEPGMEDGEATINLVLTLATAPEGVTADSVYFKGLKAPLRTTSSGAQTIYKGMFRMRSGEKGSPPMELNANDAAVVCHHANKRYLIKVADILEKEPVYAP